MLLAVSIDEMYDAVVTMSFQDEAAWSKSVLRWIQHSLFKDISISRLSLHLILYTPCYQGLTKCTR